MNPWFESIAEAERRANRRLPRSVSAALLAGSEKGVSYADNVNAFSELALAPHVADLEWTTDLSTTVMGVQLSLPVILSPVGAQAIHPEAEVAVARAAANRGTANGLSSFASKSVEDVTAANPNTFMQVYWMASREVMLQRLSRARAAGVKGLILTLDWSFSNGRDWGSPHIPESVNTKAILKFAPEALTHPRWLMEFAKRREIPDLKTPNITDDKGEALTFFGAYGEWMQSTPATWADIAWLREQWDGPFMLKGICRIDDAQRALDAGVSAISVSNHGGNNLDGTPAPIRVLPAIVEAVGDQVEVVMDGGIRRGSDVVKALALGARAVMIGRAYLWGLAANGQPGVENVLDILHSGITSTLYGLGRRGIKDLSPEDIYIPDDFTRNFGGSSRS